MRMEKILQYIKSADESELNDLLDAVLARYAILYPDWDMNVFALQKGDREVRKRKLAEILAFAEKYGNL